MKHAERSTRNLMLLVLDAVLDLGKASKAAVADRIRADRSSVSRWIDDLVEARVLEDAGTGEQPASGGQPPQLYQLHPRWFRGAA